MVARVQEVGKVIVQLKGVAQGSLVMVIYFYISIMVAVVSQNYM